MNLLKFCILSLCITTLLNIKAQSNELVPLDVASSAFGLGLDYGGLGLGFLVYPQKHVGFFIGGGYLAGGLNFNGGIKVRFISATKKSKVNPYATVMYGFNYAIEIENKSSLNKKFNGITFGGGLDFSFKDSKIRKGYWSVSMLFPQKSEETKEYISDLKNSYYVKFEKESMPVVFSFGYHFIITKK